MSYGSNIYHLRDLNTGKLSFTQKHSILTNAYLNIMLKNIN